MADCDDDVKLSQRANKGRYVIVANMKRNDMVERRYISIKGADTGIGMVSYLVRKEKRITRNDWQWYFFGKTAKD